MNERDKKHRANNINENFVDEAFFPFSILLLDECERMRKSAENSEHTYRRSAKNSGSTTSSMQTKSNVHKEGKGK
jgi:hypothetical protein